MTICIIFSPNVNNPQHMTRLEMKDSCFSFHFDTTYLRRVKRNMYNVWFTLFWCVVHAIECDLTHSNVWDHIQMYCKTWGSFLGCKYCWQWVTEVLHDTMISSFKRMQLVLWYNDFFLFKILLTLPVTESKCFASKSVVDEKLQGLKSAEAHMCFPTVICAFVLSLTTESSCSFDFK